jgi:hypothetical protein
VEELKRYFGVQQQCLQTLLQATCNKKYKT